MLLVDGKNYSFKQMHWHSPSEHHIDGIQWATHILSLSLSLRRYCLETNLAKTVNFSPWSAIEWVKDDKGLGIRACPASWALQKSFDPVTPQEIVASSFSSTRVCELWSIEAKGTKKEEWKLICFMIECRFPAELHLVHKASDGNFAVVAILYRFGDPDPLISKV